MSFSLNEVEAIARKAARGAGYPWGLADEAGKATRWLCANGLDGCGSLVALLTQIDGWDLALHRPDTTMDVWAGQGTLLCPIITGCALADLQTGRMQMELVCSPILLASFVASIAGAQGRLLLIETQTGSITTGGHGLCLEGVMPPQSKLSIRSVKTMGEAAPQISRARPDPEDWATLNAFAHRTYAPATEESRMKGAG